MALESGTYVNDLVTTNPAGTDQKSQGDDHLRLVKTVLKNTFPNASEPFRFPVTDSKAFGDSPYTMLASDENVRFEADAVGGAITFNLLAAATAGAGYAFQITKTDSSANAITLDGSGAETINGAATITLNSQYETAFVWTDGSEWLAFVAGSSAGLESGTNALFQQTAAPTGWTKQTTHNDKGLRIVSGAASSGGTDAFSTAFSSSKATDGHTLTAAQSGVPAHTHPTGGGRMIRNIDATFSQSGSGGNPGATRGSATATITEIPANTGANASSAHSHNITLDLEYVDVIIAQKD